LFLFYLLFPAVITTNSSIADAEVCDRPDLLAWRHNLGPSPLTLSAKRLSVVSYVEGKAARLPVT
jgi:hypothetical protein